MKHWLRKANRRIVSDPFKLLDQFFAHCAAVLDYAIQNLLDASHDNAGRYWAAKNLKYYLFSADNLKTTEGKGTGLVVVEVERDTVDR